MPRKLPDNLNLNSTPSQAPVEKKPIRRTKPVAPAPSFASQPSMQKPSPAAMRRPKQSSSLTAILIMLVVIVVIAVGAYFAWGYYQSKMAEEAAPEGTAAEQGAEAGDAAASEETDPTANWLTFTLPTTVTAGKAPIFSFKYPNDLQLAQNSDNLILSNESIPDTQVSVNWVKSGKSLKEYLAAMDKLNATGWEGKPSVEIATSTDSITLSGNPAVFRQQKLLAADLNQFVTYVKASDTVYAISLVAPQLDQNLLSFFIVFLNNFRFGQ